MSKLQVKALLFDVFGTVVNWRGSVAAQLRAFAPDADEDWDAFAGEWRQGYYEGTRRVAEGGQGTNNVDELHREILNSMLDRPRWKHLSSRFSDADRAEMVLFWHRLTGWPDTTEGLYALKKNHIIGTLSNGNVRLLVDMAKNADLPWDVVFSGELLGSFKPNPAVYNGALRHLALEPAECALVAAHIYDCRAAAQCGMRTVYVRRATEDPDEVREGTRARAEGGEVDVVVESFLELAEVLTG